jgi:hypothetical protein
MAPLAAEDTNLEEARWPGETIYVGDRTEDGARVTVDGREIPWRLDLWNHSPTGLEWGYGGSGPAQCALAILAHATRDDALAVKLHQRYKWDVVSRLPHTDWRLDARAVRLWARSQLERPIGR